MPIYRLADLKLIALTNRYCFVSLANLKSTNLINQYNIAINQSRFLALNLMRSSALAIALRIA